MTNAEFALRSLWNSLKMDYLVLPVCLRSEEVGNPSTVVSTNNAVDIISTPTAEVIVTFLIARSFEGVVCRQTSVLEYLLP